MTRQKSTRALGALLPGLTIATIGVCLLGGVPTTINDFHQPGTQPGSLVNSMITANVCRFCHGDYDVDQEPYARWSTSMMAQAARDPVFYACLAIANQDAANSGDLCLRCHAPVAWLEGRSTPTDGSAMIAKDFDGVSCHFCHRLVDPIADAANPAPDAAILASLGQVPTNPHSGQYVVDPRDRRRGPYDLDPNFFFHQWERSPFHREALLCANCHDVSNPVYTRQPDGTYALNALDTPHPTNNKYDTFPLERTYSEWSVSAFAQGPIEMGGRFGGNITAVSTCQDCHMPKTSGFGCMPGMGAIERDDLPQHNFNGANTWVLASVRSLYDDDQTGLNAERAADALARNLDMLARASDTELTQLGNHLRVRVVNQTGHKLPSGYPEGRRLWLNVRFFNGQNQLVGEHGAYDADTATLTTSDTKVYHAELGMDAAVAAAAGRTPGPSFHFVLNNMYYLDNRIPPRGFTNAAFAAVQAEPIGYTYADGQYWDDTYFSMPASARRVEVRLYYQTTSREYIEFLRDANVTNNAGQIAYDQWVLHGKSAPAMMDEVSLALALPGDIDHDADVDLTDLAILLANYGGAEGGDVDGDGDTDLTDLAILLANFGSTY